MPEKGKPETQWRKLQRERAAEISAAAKKRRRRKKRRRKGGPEPFNGSDGPDV